MTRIARVFKGGLIAAAQAGGGAGTDADRAGGRSRAVAGALVARRRGVLVVLSVRRGSGSTGETGQW